MPDIFDIAEGNDESPYDEYYWHDMPEFHQKRKDAYHTIKVRFRNDEDIANFSKIIGQTVTNKTYGIWHPPLDRFENSLLRYIDEEEIDEYDIED